MVNKLIIQNIQSHKHSELLLHKGVNVIIGASDSGKSAIIRALRWLIKNRPSGADLHSVWGGESVIEMHTDEGNVISRCQADNGKDNEYRLNASVFRAFGTNTPEEIINALNIADVNFQTQIAPYFLVSDSPGEVANYFNRIGHFEKIDIATQRINQNIRSFESDLKSKQTQLTSIENELSGFDDLEKIEIELEVLEEMEAIRNKKVQNLSALNTLCDDLITVNQKLAQKSRILKLETLVDSITQLIKNKQEKQEQMDEFLILIDNIIYTNEKLEKQKLILTNKQKQYEKDYPDVCPFCGKEKTTELRLANLLTK